MENIELTELCKSKNYPDYFSSDLISLYPYMIKCFGVEATDKFLVDWKYVIVNNMGASGAIYRDKKEITVNEYNRRLWAYRMVTAAIHETGHALGTLKVDTDSFLSDGSANLNDFFSKMDEAVVSDYQDDLLCGELQYDYTNTYNFKCRGDILHIDNYGVQKLYFNVFKIILGDKKDLIVKMMYEKDLNRKSEIFNEIISVVSEKLNEQQLKCLVDSCAIIVYNHGYSMFEANKKFSQRRDYMWKYLYDKNYKEVTSGNVSLDDYNREFNEWFKNIYDDKYKRVTQYVNDNGIADVDIREQCDNLCEMTIDYLIDQIDKMTEFDFELIKEACTYFSKINNRSEALKEKTQILKELLSKQLSFVEFNFCPEITDEFSPEEINTILIKLISLNDVTFDTLSKIKVMKNDTDKQDFIYASLNDTIIKIGRYSYLEKDDLCNAHDVSEHGVYVNTVIPHINLSYGNSIGDSNVNDNLKSTEKPLCKVSLKEIGYKK